MMSFLECCYGNFCVKIKPNKISPVWTYDETIIKSDKIFSICSTVVDKKILEAECSSSLLTPMCFEAFCECCSAVGESMKSWLCQNPDRHAVNNVNAHKKIWNGIQYQN